MSTEVSGLIETALVELWRTALAARSWRERCVDFRTARMATKNCKTEADGPSSYMKFACPLSVRSTEQGCLGPGRWPKPRPTGGTWRT